MTTVYLQGRVSAIYIGETGHQHVRNAKDQGEDEPTAIDCVACEKYLVREGAVYTPDAVPLTDRQERERAKIEREGNMAVKQMAASLADAAAEHLADRDAARRRSTKKTAAAG